MSLLETYEFIAIKKFNSTVSKEKGTDVPDFDDKNRSFAITLLVLNAMILEGVLKNILYYYIDEEINQRTFEGMKNDGRTKPSKMEQIFYKYRDDMQSSSTWSKVRDSYPLLLDISFKDVVDSDTNEAIEVLFSLRNILAHGAPIIQPKERMPDDEKDIYPYKWQTSTQRINVYLQKQFGGDDLFENLAKSDLPKHFMEMTTKLINSLLAQDNIKIENFEKDKNLTEILKLLSKYNFGYHNF